MGTKLLFTGLTLTVCSTLLPIPAVLTVGQILMIIGCVLMWFDR